MKCFIKSLLGQDSFKQESNDVCVPLPPLVKSLIGSVFFITLMTIVSHMLTA
ncbi:MAG: hypothetical protein V3U71_13820 [Cocleimonas sp.]